MEQNRSLLPQINPVRGNNSSKQGDSAEKKLAHSSSIVYDEDGKKTFPSPPSKKLPAFTEAYMSSPSAAGIPVLEIVRRLEEEKTLRKEDRFALNDALCDDLRREKIIKALGDVELGANPRFAIKRLRALIYGNMAGEVSSKVRESSRPVGHQRVPDSSFSAAIDAADQSPIASNAEDATPRVVVGASPRRPEPPADPSSAREAYPRGAPRSQKESSHAHDDSSVQTTSHTQLAVERVVGAMPIYSGPENFNALAKISRNLQMYLSRRGAQHQLGTVRLAIIVGSGSYNPLTRMHMRTFFIAKEYLESRCGFFVLGSLLCPAHGATVRERYRTDVSEVIPSPHRVAIAQLMVEESKWLAIDPWEITRRRAMDYMSLLQHASEMIKAHFNVSIEIKVLYLCKANMVPKLSPQALKAEGFGCVCVCRAPDSDYLRDSLNSKWSGSIWIVEDTAILDASFDMVTSRRVRDRIKAGESVENLCGSKVQDYVKTERIGPKMNRLEEWGDAEKFLPKIVSRRPATRPKPSLQ